MSDPQTTVPPTVTDAALKHASKKDIAKIVALIREGNAKPDSPPLETPDPAVQSELEELATYRETERQALLKKLPKKVIEQFKLKEESLERVKEIGTLTAALKKRDVGIDTPTTDTTIKEKKFQWNPDTLKNEMC